MDGLEKRTTGHFGGKWSKLARKHKVHFVRYADDFIITGTSREVLENEVRPVVSKFLAERGLRLSEAKTQVTHVDQGFDFLGWNVRRYNGTVLVMPSKKNVKAFLTKVREIIRIHGSAKQTTLIRGLNPILRGWANYHRSQSASKAFQAADAQVFAALWRWARRRHPKKGRRWVRQRYWQTSGNRTWVFATSRPDLCGNADSVQLVDLPSVKIRRHPKVKADYNPFDTTWEAYAENRRTAVMSVKLGYRKQVLSLYNRQQGNCAHCGTAITEESGWHDHHIVFRSMGGDDTLSNRVLVHPNCHAQIHNSDAMLAPTGASQVA